MNRTGTVEHQHTDNMEAGMAGTERKRLADPSALFWTMDDIAAHWGIKPGTVRDYRYKTEHRRAGRGPLLPDPLPDKVGINPVWRPADVINFRRRGRGTGGGPKPVIG